jgi:hypothetical protein
MAVPRTGWRDVSLAAGAGAAGVCAASTPVISGRVRTPSRFMASSPR